MKKTIRIIALLLSVMMLLAMLPAGVIAAPAEEIAVSQNAADSAVIPLLVENDEEPIDPTIPIYENTQYTFAERAADLVARMSIEQKGSQMVSAAPAISASSLGGGALNVPATKNLAAYQWWCEALHGFSHGTGNNSKNATSYPQNLTVASSWDPDLYYREACAIGDEVRERAVRNDLNNTINLNFYSPTVNMHRDPRWGRNEESYSEDVYLMSQMATQFVFGLEGKYQDGTMKDPDGYYNGHATLKHYAANNTEAIRTTGGATTDFRAIREYFTAPYRNVIKTTDVSAVMTAYSSLNGEPCSFSSYLMDTLLRQTFGFSGHITSDCDSASTIANFKFTNPYTGKVLTAVEQMSGAIAHGEDLECNEGISGNVGNYRTLAKSLVATGAQTDKGTFTENTLDVSLLRLMEARISTGEFDDNLALRIATDERIAKQTGDIGWQTPERLALIDEINKESVVMLKNDGILPLSIPEGEFNVAIVGAWQTDMYLGLYAATQLVDYDQISIQEGITNAFTKVNPNTKFTYVVKNTLTAEDEAAIAAADVAIVVAGTGNSYSAEGRDRSSNILPNGQADLISQVGKLNDKTVAIMETCGSMQVKTFQDDVNAILWSSFGGLHKGVGFASILIGETNPSGKLTDTWYQNVNNSGESDIPGINDYNMYATNGSNGRTYMYYVGKNAPSYPFGYGLSYTSFAYSNLKIDKTAYDANDTVKVSFDVTNTGSVAGKEIAQLYIAQPEAPAELLRPIKRLQGFDKILLAPGETQTVSLEVSIPDLAYFSEADDCYAVDTGLYQVQVGGNSRDIVLTENFTVSGEMDVYPEVLSVKANQAGDTELGIEERVIFDMGQTINPQLTVAMNNEKLYGYVIAHQNDKIHSVASSPLPEGMTFRYASNRPSVVKVEGDVIKAVAPGVATVTVTGELDGHVVTADFVAYVMASAKIDGITVNGQPLEGFARDKFSYELSYAGDSIPQIAGISANPDLDIEVQQMNALPGIALVRSTSRATGETLVYRIGAGAAPVSTDFSEGWEAAQAKNWAVAGGTENATFGEDGLTIVSEPGTVPAISNRYAESGFGDWIAQTHVHLAAALSQDGPQVGMLVYDDDNNYIRYSFQQVTTTSRGRTTISRVLRVYTCEDGTETQTATVTLSGTITDLDLKINKRGKEYSFGYSTDGNTWKDISGTASLAMAYPQLGVYACSGNGANIAPITATFDGINIYNVSDLYPRLSELKINGADVVGFDPEVFGYNLIVGEDDTEVPVITAKAADDAHKVTINQLDAATGVANVTVASGAASASYSICLNYEPESEYFADGEMSDRWTVLKEDPETYAIEKGKGAVLPTQYGDIHNADSGYVTSWNNVLLAPAMGNWEAVAKVVFPVKPNANYQMNLFMVWQDEANYLRQTLQNPLRITPGWEKNDSYNASNLKQPSNCVAAEDGSVTVYFLYNKVGNTYTFKWSQDGVNFEDMGKLEGVDFLNPKLGLFATQHSNSTPIDVQYEYVAITNLGGVEQMTYPEMLTWAAQNAADYVAADVPAVTVEDIVFDAVPHGYTLKVESSDPSVIAADGTVTQDVMDKNVILTITVSEGDTTASATATVKVPGTDPGVVIDDPTIPIYENPQYTFAERAADLVARMSVAQKGTQVVSTASAIPASSLGGGTLNVPATRDIAAYQWWSEALHGYSKGNTSNAVSYPQNLSVGSTWNPDLYYLEATEIGDEIRERTSKNSLGNAINLNFYSPTVNMQRDPRWGRNEESFSEDVLLNSTMATQFVLGMEGKNPDGSLIDPNGYKKAMCTVKHYTANNSERNRLDGGAVSDLRAIREYYTAPYRNVIRDAGVSSVMTAYSTLNGEPTSYSSYLMDTLLRQTFGLKGHVTSDCDSTATQNRHAYLNPFTGKTMTDIEALSGALAHGEDLECNGGYSGFGTYATKMTRMVAAQSETDKGIFTENSLDISVHRLMTDRISTGEFDENNPYTIAANERIEAQMAAKPDDSMYNQTDVRLGLAEQMAEEAVVLLQNKDDLLPLQIPASGDYTVAIVGSWQTNTSTGLYSNNPGNANRITIQKGIVDAISAIREDVNFQLIARNNLTEEDEAAIAAADVAIVVTGTTSAYSAEDKDRSDIILPDNQAALISKIGKLNENAVAIMETCGPMQVTTFQNDVKSILWSSFEGIRKVGFGRVISGAVNPSGHLTSTWHQNVSDFGESDIAPILNYNLYATDGSHGRTYMYYDNHVPVSYPFGYGLSYTTFAYSNLKLDKTAYDANDTVKVSFDVTNTGKVAGKDVAQLYVAQPDAPAELLRPIRRLEGFDKFELQPGETKSVEMEVKIPDLAFFDEADRRYEVDTGAYQIQVGADSASADLTADFTVSGEMDVYPVLLTVKANQAGDTEAGIEERLIYDMGQTVNPQLTVCMNDESLWGYIIANQQSPIDALTSTPLPEGMRFTYKSNRPSVVRVKNDVIKAVGPGVATVTVTGEMDGHVVTADFVVYVEVSANVDAITVDGKPISGFARDQYNYELSYSGEGIPVIAATSANSDLDIEVKQMDAVPGVAEITSISKTTGEQVIYRVGVGSAPVTTDFSEGWDAAQVKGWTVTNATENAAFGENGLCITSEQGTVGSIKNLYAEPAFGSWVAQTHIKLDQPLSQDGPQTGLLVYDNEQNYIRYVFQQVTTTSRNRTTISRVLGIYAVSGGEQTQVASITMGNNLTDLYLQIVKRGRDYSFNYSTDGVKWTAVSGTANVNMAYPQLAVFAYCDAAGEDIAPINATFDGINVFKVGDLYPRISSISVDGTPIAGFEEEKFGYNFVISRDETHVPVVEAITADESHTVEIQQLSTPNGTAVVTVSSGAAAMSYTVNFNYEPKSEYFADGELSSDWSILKEDRESYSIEKGRGVVLPTQYGDMHNADAGYSTSWNNVFVAPAMGNWEVVGKVVFPQQPKASYQMNLFMVWQDEANYLRQTFQNPLRVTPGWEKDDVYSSSGLTQLSSAYVAEDGSVTIYFLYKKDNNSYSFAWSQDGLNFQDLGTLENVDFANPMIGLFATEHSNAAPIDVQYEYVAVTNLNGVEQMNYAQMLEWAAQNAADYVAADVPAVTTENIVFDAVPHGYTLTVESSDPSVIAPDGTVTPAAKDKDIILTFTVSEGETTATSTAKVKVPGTNPVELPFTDIEEGRFYYNALVWAVENGITTGTEPTLFEPDSACTRAQIVTFLWRAAGCPEPETLASFKDVKANDYYAKAVAWAVEEGITNGVGKNLFAPNDLCTRGQIVTFLWRYAGKPAASAVTAFTDVDPAEYYADAVAWAVANGITEGITETRFVPEDACTRAQAITFLYRVAED